MDYLNRVPDVEPEDKMTVFLTALAAERRRSQDLSDKLAAEKERALQASNFYQLKEELDHAKQTEQMFYDSIKEIALERESKGLPLPQEVKVKNFKVVHFAYLPKELRNWCANNLQSALVVDEKVFKDAVKIGLVPDEVAYISEEKQAQVASDLSKYE